MRVVVPKDPSLLTPFQVVYVVPSSLAGMILRSVYLDITAGAFGDVSILGIRDRSFRNLLEMPVVDDIPALTDQRVIWCRSGMSWRNVTTLKSVVSIPEIVLEEGDRIEIVLAQPSTTVINADAVMVIG